MPENQIDTLALFALQEMEIGPLRWEFGARFDSHDVVPKRISPEFAARIAANRNCTTPTQSEFDDLSASVGAVWLGEQGYAIGGSLSHAIRAPGGEELFSCGPHLATQSFEVGAGELSKESALALDLSFRKRKGRLTGEINLFSNRFDDYVYEEFTGRILTPDGEETPQGTLPEFRFVQADAEFYGAELQALIDLVSGERHHVDLEISGDVVRAELSDSGEYLPRIPATRYGVGFHYRGDRWYGSAAVSRTEEQDRLAPSEMLTSMTVDGLELIGGTSDAYTVVNAHLGYRIVNHGLLHDFSLRGTNLTDETIRVHTSRLKNVAPMPGVDLSLAYRLVF